MKKYTALLLALLLTLSLTACGQTEDTGGTEWEYPAAFAGLETLVEQAQAEGSLTVYGCWPRRHGTPSATRRKNICWSWMKMWHSIPPRTATRRPNM